MNLAGNPVASERQITPRLSVTSSLGAAGAALPFFPHKENRERILHLLCGRKVPEQQFYRFLVANLARTQFAPLFCGLRGAEGDCGAAFVKRLAHVGVSEETRLAFGETYANLHFCPDLRWPDTDPLEERQRKLLWQLQELLAIPADIETSPLAFHNWLHRQQAKIVALHYRIPARQCDLHTFPLLKWYINFWNSLPAHLSYPYLILFFEFITDDTPGASLPGRLLSKLRLAAQQRKLSGLWRQLSELRRREVRLLLLNDLGPVSYDETRDWFDEFTNFSKSEIVANLAEIYKTLFASQKMQTVIDLLERIPQENLKEGAIDDVRKRFRTLRRSWQHVGRA
jgi:hypothetical protein